MKINTDKIKAAGADFLDTMKEGFIGIASVTTSVAKNTAVEGQKVLEVAKEQTKNTIGALKAGVNVTMKELNRKRE